MSKTISFCIALAALLLLGGAAPASASEVSPAAAEYCVEIAPGSVAGVPIYPGGKYCIPGP